jgi:hypothetical protein
MGRCGATEPRGVTAGTTSPAANRLAVRVTAVIPMPATTQATVLVPATVLVTVPVPATVLVTVLVLATVLVTVPVPATVLVTVVARDGRGASGAMNRAAGDREERPGGRLVVSRPS